MRRKPILLSPDAFIAGTWGMSTKEIGALWLIMLAIKSDGTAIPIDDRNLSQITKLTLEGWRKIKEAVLACLILDDGRVRIHPDFLPPPRRSLPAATRLLILDRDGHTCQYCGSTEGPFEIDHIFPWSRGGTHDPDNLTVACKPCNQEKRDLTPDEWLS